MPTRKKEEVGYSTFKEAFAEKRLLKKTSKTNPLGVNSPRKPVGATPGAKYGKKVTKRK